ncbi:MAG: hypothetical protein SFW67_27170 [Myxococcaceae bacterium]|nr:hypothetical protein [Myxococcaceae bacterium]
MNSVKLLGAVTATLLVTGCNTGQPRIWRVAYDTSRVDFVDNSSCYIGNRVPQARTAQSNYRRDANWVIWDGVADQGGQLKQYLDIGTPKFKLGDSPEVVVEDVIEGDAALRSFTAERQVARFGPMERGRNAIETLVGRITVLWDNYNPAATGLITINSEYKCVDNGQMQSDQCPRGGGGDPVGREAANCSVQVSFVARRIDVTQATNYSNNGCDGAGCSGP